MNGERELAGDCFAVRLESEGLVRLTEGGFVASEAEIELMLGDVADWRAKNVSLSPGGEVRGSSADAETQGRLAAMMQRYARWAEATLHALAPSYAGRLQRGRTSLRTREVAEGAPSRRKDDRLLHVDAFASQPTGGKRILRVFTNISPEGRARVWRIGEPFEDHARRWADQIRRPLPGENWVLQHLGVTRARRSAYDTLMLGLHDRAKLDDEYQACAPYRDAAFAPGESWIVYTDSVVHAAMTGRYALEQTFYLPLEAMAAPTVAPARILERLTGRSLV
jgi:hypothetical protein